MSTHEDGQEQTPSTPQPHSDEAATGQNSNSIIGLVKSRVSSIFPDSLSKWFSPTAAGSSIRHAADNAELSQQQQQQQQNGSALTVKRKRSRRRIQLEVDADDDAPDTMDDGIDAQDLNDEEVQLADNIAEHDLAAEDEQTRRNEYNVSLLRKRQQALAASREHNNNDDDDDDDDDGDADGVEEEEDDDEQDDADSHPLQSYNYSNRSNAFGLKLTKPNNNNINNNAAQQPPSKRTRFERSEIPFSPQLNAQGRRRPQLHASTPAATDAALRSHAPPNRLAYMNLYGHLRQREPAFNFTTGIGGAGGGGGGGSSSEAAAAVATSGDLPMSSRRVLNIPPMSERRYETMTMLPSYKRQSLMGGQQQQQQQQQQRGSNWRTCLPINELTSFELPQHQQQQQQPSQETNNNNTINAKRGTDSHSECESNESNAGLGIRTHNNNNNNNNMMMMNNTSNLFYGNLQSRKSVFNAFGGCNAPPHYNSTLSLNSLNNRRRFNASIYGSTSALSDSRLLSSSVSSTGGESPFYRGPTTFGGMSANSRYFSQGNLNTIHSGGSSPAPSNVSDSISSGGRISNNNYGNMKPVEMRPKNTNNNNNNNNNSSSSSSLVTDGFSGVSQTAQRILNLLENHTTPLMDAKKMGSTLREHQLQRTNRTNRHAAKPYSCPTAYASFNHSSSNNNSNICNITAEQDSLSLSMSMSGNSSKLSVPTMLELLKRRRLQRVLTPATRQQINEELQQQQPQNKLLRLTTTTTTATSLSATTITVTTTTSATSVATSTFSFSSTTNTVSSLGSHTNKMRSRLSHQTRKDSRTMDDELPPPPIDLPNIRFPNMASEPKFDLAFVPSPKPTTATTTTTPVVATTTTAVVSKNTTTAAATNLNSVDCSSKKSKHHFKFDAALPLICQDESLPLKRVELNFLFTPPTPLDVQQQQEQQQQPQKSDKELQLNGDRSLRTSGSVLDVLLPTAAAAVKTPVASSLTTAAAATTTATTFAGFADRFKKPTGNWECEACMLSNKTEATKCIACETPKPAAKSATPAVAVATTAATVATTAFSATTSFAGFADRFKKPAGNWECDACMLSNKTEATKCIACETPRKGTTPPAATSALSSNSLLLTTATTTATTSGFGDAFKPKANTWQCDTCMITNQSKDNACIACQTPNPKANSSSSSNTATAAVPTATSNFKFGFANATAATTTVANKPDVGFQQLIAAQKASSWTCEACTAQNDVARNKCICCEELKPGAADTESTTTAKKVVPKFMFGFANSAATVATTSATVAATTNVAPAAQFTFGFGAAPGKDVADKPETTAAAAATATPAAETTGFKFGAETTTTTTSGNKTVAFKLSEPQQAATTTAAAAAAATTQQPAEAADTTAPKTATSSLGFGVFTAAATTPAAAAATAKSVVAAATPIAPFTFGSNTTAAATTSIAEPTVATTTEAGNKLFSFGSFTATSTMSSSSGSSSSTSTSTTNSSNSKPAAAIFGFGNSGSMSQQPAVTTTTTTSAAATAPTSTLFGQQTSSFAAGTATSTAAAAKPAATFVFGNQATNTAAATTTTTSNATTASSNPTSNFFFGSPAAAVSTTTAASVATAPATAFVSAANNSMNLFSSTNTLAKSSNIAPTPANTTAMFNFGSGNNNNNSSSTFSFGSKPAAATSLAPTTTTTAADVEFNWSTTTTTTPAAAAATTPANQFASFGSIASATTATSNATPAAASPFSMTVADANASGIAGGNGGLSSIFGNVTNPFNNSGNNATAAAAPLANIFNSSASNNNSSTAATTVAAATTTSIAKPVFNFGSGPAPSTPTAAIFNFGAGSSNPVGASKPAFNFTATGPAPQAAAFNFSGNVGTTGTSATSGNDLFPTPERLFQFGAPASTSGNVSVGGVTGTSSLSSSIVPASGQLFNFTGSTQQMQSTPNAAPFQFNAGAPAPTNIFAFNPPNAGNNNMQNPRRKIRAPIRRLPPR